MNRSMNNGVWKRGSRGNKATWRQRKETLTAYALREIEVRWGAVVGSCTKRGLSLIASLVNNVGWGGSCVYEEIVQFDPTHPCLLTSYLLLSSRTQKKRTHMRKIKKKNVQQDKKETYLCLKAYMPISPLFMP